jgi:hypothetical protein
LPVVPLSGRVEGVLDWEPAINSTLGRQREGHESPHLSAQHLS